MNRYNFLYHGSRELKTEQVRGLVALKDKYGPTWKQQLVQLWHDGKLKDEHDGKVLSSLLLELGTAWLEKYRLPRQVKVKKKRSVRTVSGGLPSLGKRR